MILNNRYIVYPTSTFKEELSQIIYYTKYNLKEPSISDNLYKTIISEINSLQFMPERFSVLNSYNYQNKNY